MSIVPEAGVYMEEGLKDKWVSYDTSQGLNINIIKSHNDNITDMIDGKATVNGSNLLGIIKRLKNEEILLEASNNNLVIKQNNMIY